MSEVKVNKVTPRSGTAVQLGDSGDTFTVPSGATLTASMIGYSDKSMDASRTVNFQLSPSALEMSGLEVLASRADEKTPVAYTTVSKAEMEGAKTAEVLFEKMKSENLKF